MIASTLWRANVELATACMAHPFVRGLADGSLPPSVFRVYIAQDTFFLEAFARGYAFALARSPDRVGLDAFHALTGGVLDELKLHVGYAERLGIDLVRVEPLDSTLAYTDFLLATAATAGVGDICAAMTPCMRLYAFLGQRVAAEPHANTYEEWINTYASAEFQMLATQLEELLDRYASDTPLVRMAYRRAMQLERKFFEGAWQSRIT